jgi:hypothetical protein
MFSKLFNLTLTLLFATVLLTIDYQSGGSKIIAKALDLNFLIGASNNCNDVHIMEPTDGSVLYLSSLTFETGTANCVIDLLKNKTGLHIFSSPGGIAAESIALSNHIFDNNIDVTIESRCVSACFLLLVSSPTGNVCRGAEVAIHHAGNRPNSPEDAPVLFGAIDFFVANQIKLWGGDSEYYLSKIEGLFEDEVYNPSLDELIGYRFMQKVGECDTEILYPGHINTIN